MSEILSIQSHVAYGYVGNRAAVFPLQRMGYDVTAVNTVQFSNHTGYGVWQGDVMTAEHIANIINGLQERGVLQQFQALLSGYVGDVTLGEIILQALNEIKSHNPDSIYCCDPVMGDIGRGFFVRPDLPEFIKNKLVPQATIITPNKFEAEFLADREIQTLSDALEVCQQLTEQGPEIVLITSLETDATNEHEIQMLAYQKQQAYLITAEKFIFDIAPNGSGDATAAIFSGDYLKHRNLKQALEHVTNSIYYIFKQTYDKKTRELQLISAQNQIDKPKLKFTAKKL